MSDGGYHAGSDLGRARRVVVEICRTMHARGLLAGRDGNVSVRIGSHRLLITPSGARKGYLRPEDCVLCDLMGRPETSPGHGKPSSEVGMHLAVYEARPDVRAVVHAHPPAAVAHTVAGVPLEPLMPEVYCELGDVKTLDYTTPGTPEVGQAVGEAILGRTALLMSRHGSITVGETLTQAYDRLEILEHAARISLMARTLSPNGIFPLSPAALAALTPAG